MSEQLTTEEVARRARRAGRHLTGVPAAGHLPGGGRVLRPHPLVVGGHHRRLARVSARAGSAAGRGGVVRTCDYPGCDEPATHYAQAGGANTPLKEWFGCDRHLARALPGARSSERAVPIDVPEP